jgi:hypothetical protein
MKKRLLIMLIVLTGIFIYTSTVYACEGGHNSGLRVHFDPADKNNWSMKIKISGSTESIMNIVLKDYTKEEKNPKGYRQLLGISMIHPDMPVPILRTQCKIFIDDSKDPVIYTYYSVARRIKRHSKTEFENNKYENTALTLKEIMDTAEKLIDRDQVKVNDITVTVMERNITSEAFNRVWY